MTPLPLPLFQRRSVVCRQFPVSSKPHRLWYAVSPFDDALPFPVVDDGRNRLYRDADKHHSRNGVARFRRVLQPAGCEV